MFMRQLNKVRVIWQRVITFCAGNELRIWNGDFYLLWEVSRFMYFYFEDWWKDLGNCRHQQQNYCPDISKNIFGLRKVLIHKHMHEQTLSMSFLQSTNLLWCWPKKDTGNTKGLIEKHIYSSNRNKIQENLVKQWFVARKLRVQWGSDYPSTTQMVTHVIVSRWLTPPDALVDVYLWRRASPWVREQHSLKMITGRMLVKIIFLLERIFCKSKL